MTPGPFDHEFARVAIGKMYTQKLPDEYDDGYLWDYTDKEIDRMVKDIYTSWEDFWGLLIDDYTHWLEAQVLELRNVRR